MPDVPPQSHRPYAAYLRVYEPLAAFPEAERADLEQLAAQPPASGGPSPSAPLAREQRRAMAGVLAVPPRPVPAEESADAFVLHADSQVLVCPVQSRLRSWVALGEFRDGMPDAVLHAFLPPASLERADADHAVWGAVLGDSGAPPPVRIRTATWAVPVHWFVAFAPEDGELQADGPAPSLVYRARMSAVRRRLARALRTLNRAVGQIDYVEELDELGRWFEEFHPRSWVELDYGGLTRLLGPERLREDASVAEVTAALTALAEGDEEAAVAAYQGLVERWAAINSLERAN